jgi:hypothetical protein
MRFVETRVVVAARLVVGGGGSGEPAAGLGMPRLAQQDASEGEARVEGAARAEEIPPFLQETADTLSRRDVQKEGLTSMANPA